MKEHRLIFEVGSFGSAPEAQPVAPRQQETIREVVDSNEVNETANTQANETIDIAKQKVAQQAELVASADPNTIREAAGLLEPTVEEKADDDAGAASLGTEVRVA